MGFYPFHGTGKAIFCADFFSPCSGTRAEVSILYRGLDGLGEFFRCELLDTRGFGANPRFDDKISPGELIPTEGNDDLQHPRSEACPGRPRTAVMDHCPHAGKQPPVRNTAHKHHTGGRGLWGHAAPPGQDHPPLSGQFQRAEGEAGVPGGIFCVHTAKAEIDGGRAFLEETEQVGGGLKTFGVVQKPVASDMLLGVPIDGFGEERGAISIQEGGVKSAGMGHHLVEGAPGF